jgi:hypothetical protein
MEVHAPAAAPYTVVTLDQPREVGPRRFIERSHFQTFHAGTLLAREHR